MAGKNLVSLVHEAIDKLALIGLCVKCVICDQGSNNRNFMQTLCGVSVGQPYFTYNGHKVYALYDPPHLLKNIRNNFKRHVFLWKGNEIKWKYVSDFYDFDKGNKIRLAPKLTDAHIEVPPFKTMRVNLAAQVLSHSVAAGIYTLSQLKVLPKEAEATAEFIENMDQLFNAFNSKSIHSKQNFGHTLSSTSGHIEFLKSSLQFMEELTLMSPTVIYCITGWKISINTLLGLWQDLHDNNSFQSLLTNRLNQDCAMNLFSIIRGKGGHRDNPDATEFRAAYRQVVFDQMLMQSVSSNCTAGMDSVLLSLINISHKEPAIPTNQFQPVLSDEQDKVVQPADAHGRYLGWSSYYCLNHLLLCLNKTLRLTWQGIC